MAFQKFDDSKPPMSLIPPLAMLEVGKGMQIGAENYGEDNYLQGSEWRRYSSAALRHIFKWLTGNDWNIEVTQKGNTYKIHHLASAIASLMILLEQVLLNVGRDDRPTIYKQQNDYEVNMEKAVEAKKPEVSGFIASTNRLLSKTR